MLNGLIQQMIVTGISIFSEIILVIYTASKVKHPLYFLLNIFSNYREEILLHMENIYLS